MKRLMIRGLCAALMFSLSLSAVYAEENKRAQCMQGVKISFLRFYECIQRLWLVYLFPPETVCIVF